VTVPRRALVPAAAAVVVFALALNSCGKNALSAPALRRDATRVCTLAKRRIDAISVPRSPKAAGTFLTRGVAALGPELATLRELDPSNAAAAPYKRALDALSQELITLESAAAAIDRGADPILTFRTLQARLAPIEARADEAFRTLQIDACTSR
jgi:hypothetical protein